MEYNLFLDDMRDPQTSQFLRDGDFYKRTKWVVVKNYDEFVSYITKNGMPELISFDHDLADEHYGTHDQLDEIEYLLYEEKTGYHCAKWLIDYCMDNNVEPPRYLVHSMNTAGAINIKYLIENYKRFLKSQK
jgi:hypothetical protein